RRIFQQPVITEIVENMIGINCSQVRPEPVIGKNDLKRVEGFNFLEQAPNVLIEGAVTLTHPLNAPIFFVVVTTSEIDVSPQLVLDPVGLLEMHHEHIPRFTL